MAAGLLFGLAPALTAAWHDLGATLRGGRGVGATGDPRGRRLRAGLVVGEVAIALVLSTAAGLMMRTLWELSRVDPGGWGADLVVEGQPLAAGATPPRAGWRVVAGEYFRAMGIPLLMGRGFGPQDRAGASPVLIINRRLANQLWAGESPLRKRINAGNATGGEWATVVGVVGDVHHNSLRGDAVPEIYRPLGQYPHGGMTLVVSAAADAMELARPVSQAVWAVDPDVPITAVRSMEQVAYRSVSRPRLVRTVLATFAALALLLGAVGIYGVIAYTVTQRTREIGLRMALGADAGAVIRRVLWQGLGYAAAGTLIGLVTALLLGRALSGLLFGVRSYDPITFAGVALFILLVAGAASLPPARRAARLDPITALREE
jgi:putative ABC transport system permease protein